MVTNIVLINLAALVAAATAERKYTPFEVSTACMKTECCVPEERFWIVSKRELRPVFEDRIKQRNKGRCVSYIVEGKSCHYPGFAECGCEPGTSCIHYPEKLPLGVGKRDMMMPRPGKSICEKKKMDKKDKEDTSA